jgi:hypothetical protein
MSVPPQTSRRQALAAELLPIARRLLEQSNAGDSPAGPLRQHIRSLMQGLESEHAVTAVLGALASAVLDLDGAVTKGVIRADDPPELLTKQLFRLAYNRWQNEHRREERLLRAAQRNYPANSDVERGSGNSPINSVQKNHNSPLFNAQIRELHDYMVETLDPQDMLIWIMYAEGFTEDEIAKKIRRHRTTVNRKVRRFGEIIAKLV